MDDFTTNYKNKKKVLKIRFLEYGRVVDTRRSVLLYIYIYIYIYILVIVVTLHPKGGITIHTRFLSVFFI